MDTVARHRLDSIALIAGTVASGIAVYAVSIIGIRTYGTATFAPISVLWAFWAVLAAVLTFPIQHWVIHRIAADGSEDAVALAMPRVLAAGVGLATVLAAAAWLWSEPLFGDRRLIWPALLALLTVGTVLTGLVRGVLAGRRRFGAVASVIASENLLRLALCSAVVIAGGSITAFGIAFAAGALCVAAWPDAFRFTVVGTSHPPTLVRFIGGLGAGNALAQIALNIGPVVLSAMGGSPQAVTSLFVTMALFRAPYFVALGLSVQLTGPVTRLTIEGRSDTLRRIARMTTAVTLVFAVLAYPLGVTTGVFVVELVYGSTAVPDATVVGLVAAGSALALGTLALSVMLAAQSATTGVVTAWAVSMFAAAVLIGAVPSEAILSIALGFATAEAIALVLLLAAAERASVPPRAHGF